MALDYQTSETIPAQSIIADDSGRDNLTPQTNGLGYSAGSFAITFNTKSGTTTEQPVFNFALIKAVAA